MSWHIPDLVMYSHDRWARNFVSKVEEICHRTGGRDLMGGEHSVSDALLQITPHLGACRVRIRVGI